MDFPNQCRTSNQVGDIISSASLTVKAALLWNLRQMAYLVDQMKMVPVSPLTDFSFDFQDLLFTPVPSNASGKQ